MASTFWQDFRRRFTRGLAAILPTLVTIALIVWLFNIANNYVGRYIDRAAISATAYVYKTYYYERPSDEVLSERYLQPPSDLTDMQVATDEVAAYWQNHHLNIVSFLLAIVLVYILGLFLASFIGRGVWRGIEGLILRVPLIRQIYPIAKQVTDFFFSEKRLEFHRVVAVEYPRKGIWSIGLVTNASMRTLQGAVGGDLLTIFVPSSPTPFTGYTMTVRRDEVVDLPLTIEQALQFTVSGGVILPPAEMLTEMQIRRATEGESESSRRRSRWRIRPHQVADKGE